MLVEPTYLCMRKAFLCLPEHITIPRINIYSWEKEEEEAGAPAIRYSADNRCWANYKEMLLMQWE